MFYPASQDPAGAARHWVEISALQPFLEQLLGFDPSRQPAGVADWLATPTQRLAEVTGGAVYHDGPGELTLVRARLAWYPDQVWRYVLACQWQRIAQEEAFPGRCAEAGDELGAAVVAARLARDLMRLCLLMRRRYPPYSKWLGSAFARLPEAAAIGPALTAALAATDAGARERGLCRAYELAAARHNELGLTDPVDPRTRPYYDRPFQVLDAGASPRRCWPPSPSRSCAAACRSAPSTSSPTAPTRSAASSSAGPPSARRPGPGPDEVAFADEYAPFGQLFGCVRHSRPMFFLYRKMILFRCRVPTIRFLSGCEPAARGARPGCSRGPGHEAWLFPARAAA